MRRLTLERVMWCVMWSVMLMREALYVTSSYVISNSMGMMNPFHEKRELQGTTTNSLRCFPSHLL
jgi:hypothetical protein